MIANLGHNDKLLLTKHSRIYSTHITKTGTYPAKEPNS